MAEELNKLELLIKVMKMTGAEDNIALVALRKANAMLASEGWDWEKLLRGKIKVIADPFAGGSRIPTPPTPKQATPSAASQFSQRPPQQPFRRTSNQPLNICADCGVSISALQFRCTSCEASWQRGRRPKPQPATAAPSAPPKKVNAYPGTYRGCNIQVGPGAGFAIKHGTAWKLFCIPCSQKPANSPKSINLDDLL